MTEGTLDEVLSEEKRHFLAVQDELLTHHEGKFVVVVASEVLGTFDTFEAAYAHGIQSKGNVPMLIRRVAEEELCETAPAMTLCIMHVRP